LQISNTILRAPTDQLGEVAQPANRKRAKKATVRGDLFIVQML
jgi:hypothetical protein